MTIDGATCTSTVSGSTTKTIDIGITYLDYVQNYQAEVTASVNGEAVNVNLLNWEQI